MGKTIVSNPERCKGVHPAAMTMLEERLLCLSMKGPAASVLNEQMRARLKAAREALGLKSGEVARGLGLAISTYSRYETGVTPIPIKVLADLDRMYRITPSYIISGSVIDLQPSLREALDVDLKRKTKNAKTAPKTPKNNS